MVRVKVNGVEEKENTEVMPSVRTWTFYTKETKRKLQKIFLL